MAESREPFAGDTQGWRSQQQAQRRILRLDRPDDGKSRPGGIGRLAA